MEVRTGLRARQRADCRATQEHSTDTLTDSLAHEANQSLHAPRPHHPNLPHQP